MDIKGEAEIKGWELDNCDDDEDMRMGEKNREREKERKTRMERLAQWVGECMPLMARTVCADLEKIYIKKEEEMAGSV